MGYYTNFSLRMIGSADDIDDVVNAASNLKENEDDDINIDGIKEIVEKEEIYAKWYCFEEDFTWFAKQFPKVLFVINGSGEEEMDIWELRIKGEKKEYHQVEMPPFTTPELLLEDEK